MWIWAFLIFVVRLRCINCIDDYTKCYNNAVAKTCYPPFSSAAYRRNIDVTNTCGLNGPQKYCIDLSDSANRFRCQYCNNNSLEERHPASYITDDYENTWWQSETLAHNRQIHYNQSVNLTLNLGTQFYVTYVFLKFKSPRPSAMTIYKKFNAQSDWEPWQHYAINCMSTFGKIAVEDMVPYESRTGVLCTQAYSTLNNYYDGDLVFSTIKDRPDESNFQNSKELQRWATASQIRIALKKMHTFGDENVREQQTLLTYFYSIKKMTVGARCLCHGHSNKCVLQSDSVSFRCQCVHNTIGENCESCAPGFHDIPWKAGDQRSANPCKECQCNGNTNNCVFDEELFIRSGNVSGSSCIGCQFNTEGPNCEKCILGFTPDPQMPTRCLGCGCDTQGSVDFTCDKMGQCSCKPGVGGKRCDQCLPGFYNMTSEGCKPCNCVPAGTIGNKQECNPITGQCICKKNVQGEKCSRCFDGYFGLSEKNPVGCQACFCFGHSTECGQATDYMENNIVSSFSSGADGWIISDNIVDLPDPPIKVGDGFIQLPDTDVPLMYQFVAPKKFLGDMRLTYNRLLLLDLALIPRDEAGTDYSIIPVFYLTITGSQSDQIISYKMTLKDPFNRERSAMKIRITEESPDFSGQRLGLREFMAILSNVTSIQLNGFVANRYIRLYSFTLMSAQKLTQINGGAIRDLLAVVATVEQCQCPPFYSGDSCQSCKTGYHRRIVNGSPFVECIPCTCNGNADDCDPATGVCKCLKNTAGNNCDQCADGFFNNSTISSIIDCVPCPCPGNGKCAVFGSNGGIKAVCTECPPHQTGIHCMSCEDGYYGNPKQGITCKKCDCNMNVDFNSVGYCDGLTGQCTRCVYNTTGDHCQECKPGYHGNALATPTAKCSPCNCDRYGSQADLNGILRCTGSLVGTCDCKRNVMGEKCDVCHPGYYGIKSGEGCKDCRCHYMGAKNTNCTEEGQCACKPGVGGERCDACLPGFYNLTRTGCTPCKCDVNGAANSTCNDEGVCKCKENVIGDKCDKCQRNFFDVSQSCKQCPACYDLVNTKFIDMERRLRELENVFTGKSEGPKIDNSDWNAEITKILNDVSKAVDEAQMDGGMKSSDFSDVANALRTRLEILKNNVTQVIKSLEDLDKDKKRYQVDPSEIKKQIEELNRLEKFIKDNGTARIQALRESVGSGVANAEMQKYALESERIAQNVVDNNILAQSESRNTNQTITSVNDIMTNLPQIVASVNTQTTQRDTLLNDFNAKLDAVNVKIAPLNNVSLALHNEAVRIRALIDKFQIPSLKNKLDALEKSLTFTNATSVKLLHKMRRVAPLLSKADIDKKLAEIEERKQKAMDAYKEAEKKFAELVEIEKEILTYKKKVDDAYAEAEKTIKEINELKANFNRTRDADRARAIVASDKMDQLDTDIALVEQNLADLLPGLDRSRLEALDAANRTDQLIADIANKTDELQSIYDHATKGIQDFTDIVKNANEFEAKAKRLANEAVTQRIKTQQVDSDSKMTLAVTKNLKATDKMVEDGNKMLQDLDDMINFLNDIQSDKTEEVLMDILDDVLAKFQDIKFDDRIIMMNQTLIYLNREYTLLDTDVTEMHDKSAILATITDYRPRNFVFGYGIEG